MNEEIFHCKCNGQITISGCYGGFTADEEPYEAGKYEEVSDEIQNLIENIDFYLTATMCLTCKKIYFWSDTGICVGTSDIELP